MFLPHPRTRALLTAQGLNTGGRVSGVSGAEWKRYEVGHCTRR